MTKQIPLTRGMVALVSDHRFEALNSLNWYVLESGRNFYAVRQDNRKMILMHRLITGAPDGVPVDHRDGNGLNNVDENLRLCNPAQNTQNKRVKKNSTIGLRGVSIDKLTGRYKAYIQPNRKYIHLGYFDTPEEAGKAYDQAAVEIYGEFARTNF